MPRGKLIGYLQLTKFIQLSINEPLQEEIIFHSSLNRCTITDYFEPVQIGFESYCLISGNKAKSNGMGLHFLWKNGGQLCPLMM